MNHNVVGWVEIPVSNMERAIAFYKAVFGFEIDRNMLGALDMGWFPFVHDGIGAGGSLVYAPEHYVPSEHGVLVYFTAPSGDMDIELKKAESAGGKVVVPKKLIAPGFGYMAVITDSEGNRIALHTHD